MWYKGICRALSVSVVLSSFILMTACGGSGGNGSNGSDLTGGTAVPEWCIGSKIENLELNKSVNKNISEDTSQCFKFTVSENSTYRVIADPSGGDVDIAAYSSSSMDDASVTVYSIKAISSIEELIFTADKSGEYYIEVYGYSESKYNLRVHQADTNEHIAVSKQELSINLISSDGLPSNQRLVQPEAATQFVTVNYAEGYYFQSIQFNGDVALPGWLSFDDVSIGNTSNTYEYKVNDTNLPSGKYVVSTRFTVVNGSNVKVSQVVDFNYMVSERPYSLSSTNNKVAPNNSRYSFDLIDDATEALSYSVEYAPNGMDVDTNGSVSWDAALPMVTNPMEIKWGIRTTLGDVSIIIEDILELEDTLYKQPVTRTGKQFSDFVSDGNMAASDWDNDGKTEIILSDMHKVLYSLEYDGVEYVEDWVAPYALSDKQKINTLLVSDLNKDGVDELVVGMVDVDSSTSTEFRTAELYILNGVTKEVVKVHNVDMEMVRSLHADDIDNDGKIELVVYGVRGSSRLISIYEGIDLVHEWSSNTLSTMFGQSIVRLGNIDSDPAIEIVSGTGHVIDGSTYSINLLKPDGYPGYPMTLNVGDVDDDGIDEIIHSTNDSLFIYDGSDGSLKHQIDKLGYYDGRFAEVVIGDATGDGRQDLITARSGNKDTIVVYLYNKSTETFDIVETVTGFDYTSAARALKLNDYDNDGAVELLWREGGGSTAKDGIVIAEFTSVGAIGSIEWYTNGPSEFSYEGFYTPHLTKDIVNGNKIWFISNDSQEIDSSIDVNRGPRLISLDLLTNKLSVTDPLYTYSYCSYYSVLDMVDLNSDLNSDALIPQCNIGFPTISYDLVNDVEIQSSEISSTYGVGRVKAIGVGDFGNNGSEEVAIVGHSSSIHVYNPLTNEVIWEHNHGTEFYGVDMQVTDLENDNSLDLIVALGTKILKYSYNGGSPAFSQSRELSIPNISDIVVADLNGDGIQEISVIHGNYIARYLSVYDHLFNLIASHELSERVTSVHLEDLPGARKNLLIATEKDLGYGVFTYKQNYLSSIDPLSGKEVWRTPNLIGSIPLNSLRYDDVDGDSDKEIIFTTNKSINVIQ